MSDETKNDSGVDKTRRIALKNVAQVAATAPAVSLLLDANTKALAQAVSVSYSGISHVLDDFTYGNTHEDLGNFPGAIDDGSNFPP